MQIMILFPHRIIIVLLNGYIGYTDSSVSKTVIDFTESVSVSVSIITVSTIKSYRLPQKII